MGNSLPGQINFNLDQQGWLKSKSSQGVTIWTNPRTQQQLQEYSFIVSDTKQLQNQQSSFRLRYNSAILVSGKYFKKHQQIQYCSQFNKGDLYIQRIPLRLHQINRHISYSQVLYIYKQCIIGFDILAKYAGPFDINENMICLTKEGIIKVWLHENLSRSLPELRFDGSSATQLGMIKRVIDLIENQLDFSIPANTKSIKQHFNENDIRTLMGAYNILEKYSRTYPMPIANKLNLFNPQNNISQIVSQKVKTFPQNKVVYQPKLQKIKQNNPHIQTNLSVLNQKHHYNHEIIQRPHSSILYNLPSNHVHHQDLTTTLKFEPKVVSTYQPRAELHHSQSLLNLKLQNHQDINNLNIMNYKNRAQARSQSQSLINIAHNHQTQANNKRINQFILSPKAYPKHPNAHHTIQTKKSLTRPLTFSSNHSKNKHPQSNISNKTINFQNHQYPSKHHKKARNFKSINEIRSSSKVQIHPKIQRSYLPNFQFTPKSTKLNTKEGIAFNKVQTINNYTKQSIKDQRLSQIPVRNQKVCQVYLQRSQKRTNTQPHPQSNYFKNEVINHNGLAFKDHHHLNFYRNSKQNKSIPKVNGTQIQKVQNHQVSLNQNTVDPTLMKVHHCGQAPMGIFTGYINTPIQFNIESLKLKNNSQQKFLVVHKNLNNLSQISQQNINKVSNTLNTFRTINEQSESVNQSRQHIPGYQMSSINPELLQDLQRLRKNSVPSNVQKF